MTKRINIWRWGALIQRGGRATPWPWTEIRIYRRQPRYVADPGGSIQPYRIGWGRLASMATKYRHLLPMIVRGVQGDGQRVARRGWIPTIRRDLRTLLTRHPKYLLHRPWQAEADGQRFARRAFTPAAAARRMIADVDYEALHGKPARYQRWRRLRARRWDRKNIPA